MPLPDYSLTKIYKLVSNQTDEIYIGSTCQKYLSTRMGQHRRDYKNYINGKFHYITSYEILKYDDAKIVLLQSYPKCENSMELRKYEQEHIDKMNCINKNRAYSTIEDVKRKQKEYYKDNVEKIKEYYKDNIEKIKIRKTEKIECECGSMIVKGNIATHRKRPIHLKNLLKTTNCFS